MSNFDNRTHLKNAMRDIGEDVVIKFMFLAYLQSNFLRDQIDDHQFQEMIHISTGGVALDTKNKKHSGCLLRSRSS